MPTSSLLTKVQSLAPSFGEIDPKTINLDRIGTLASEQLRQCDNLNLLSTVWRGRIILQTKSLYEQRKAEDSYYAWLKINDISEKKAELFISLARSADELIDQGRLTTESMQKITLEAFQIAHQDPTILGLIADMSLDGNAVNKHTASRLIDEQKVTTCDVFSTEVVNATSSQVLKPSKVAKLVDNLAQLDGDVAAKIAEPLTKEPKVEVLKVCLKQSASQVKYRETAPLIESVQDIDTDALLAEAEALKEIPLLSEVTALLKELETLTVKIHQKKAKLEDKCDRLFCQSGAAQQNIRALCEPFTSNNRWFQVPLDSNGNAVRIEIQVIEPESK